jgi:hypothetical protein
MSKIIVYTDFTNLKTHSFTRQEALQLELMINYIPKLERWIRIGDVLYKFSQGNASDDVLLKVTPEEYSLLMELHFLQLERVKQLVKDGYFQIVKNL